MNYIEVKFVCDPHNEIVTGILTAMLGEVGFESFSEDEEGVLAYVQGGLFDEENIRQVVSSLPVDAQIAYTWQEIKDKNWNEEWEKNYFEPLIIDNKCIIQSTFHNVPPAYDYNIYIDPKMAFGTGHHQTTELMIREILKTDFAGKRVLDMGCGTAILAILASMRGAGRVTAIDIDRWAYDNAVENLSLNNVSNVEIKIGGAELLADGATYDIILANINRNILLDDICRYASVMSKGGVLYMSGFYTEDIGAIEEECKKYGLWLSHASGKDNWACVKFTC